MRPLSTAFLTDALGWWTTIVNNANRRWLNAVDKIEDPQSEYSAEKLIEDVYGLWKDVVSFPVLGAVGGFPYNAFIRVDRWAGTKTSNPIPKLMTPTPIGDDTQPIPGNPDPILITPLIRVGSNGEVFPAASGNVEHIKIRDSNASVAVALEGLNHLAGAPPTNGNYIGWLYQSDAIIAHVNVLVEVGP